METTATLGTLAIFAAALAAGGAIAGFLAGLLGIGGGAILVPIVYQVMEIFGVDDSVRMHIAVGTSLGIIIPTSIRSFMAHRARGAVDEALLKRWIVPVCIGVGLGTLVAALSNETALKAVFVILAYSVAARMLLVRQTWQLGTDMPGHPALGAWGAGIGFLSVLMGIGGGVLANTVMTMYGRTIHQAVATSSGLGVIISIPGAIGFVIAGWGSQYLPPLSLGYVSVIAVLMVIPVTFLTAPLGVRVAHALTKRQLELAFGVFLILMGTRFLVDLLLP